MADEFTTTLLPEGEIPDYMILVKDDPASKAAAIRVYLEPTDEGVSKLAQAVGGVVFSAALQIHGAGKSCHVGCAVLTIIEVLLDHMAQEHPQYMAEYAKAAYQKTMDGASSSLRDVIKGVALAAHSDPAAPAEWCTCGETAVCAGLPNCKRKAN